MSFRKCALLVCYFVAHCYDIKAKEFNFFLSIPGDKRKFTAISGV